MAKHFANVDVRGDLRVRGFLEDNLRVRDEVEAAAFYIRGVGELTVGGSGVSDHGGLTGLADDDHTQYLLVDAGRSATHDFTFEQRVTAEAFYVASGGELSERGLLASAGTTDAPSISFINDADTGMFSAAADNLGFSAGGVERMLIGIDGVRVNDKIKAEGFYLNSGWDYTESTLDFDIPVVSLDNYFIHSFAPQPFVIEDVKAVTSTGAVTVGFYVIGEGESIHYGQGIPGLDPFYIGPSVKTKDIADFQVNPGDSVLMSSFENRNSRHLRGRLRVSLLR